jgi:hypothetical protein
MRSRSLESLPLEVRFLNTIIERTSDILGFNKETLDSRGTKAIYVVYSLISKFNVFFETLIDICTDRN